MEREHSLELVRSLTRSVLELFCPGRLETFEADFALWALTAGVPQAAEKVEALRPQERGLDTTLVAGMFFQVLTQAAQLPASAPERVSFVRKEAKNYLVQHLAGQITMSQFYRLLNLIEERVQHYFEHLGRDWTGLKAGPQEEARPRPPAAVQGEELRRALARLEPQLKGRRITAAGLEEFLRDSAGRWFRVLDLETHFKVNKKTAWGYLNLLLKGGILKHNGEKANRARYALAASFQAAPPRPPMFTG